MAAYAPVSELQRVLGIGQPTAAQTEAMQRVLDEAAEEIDRFLGYSAENPAPSPVSPIVVGVNLDRAMELWRQSLSPFGIIPVGPDTIPIVTARDTFHRHRLRLRPLQTAWGVG